MHLWRFQNLFKNQQADATELTYLLYSNYINIRLAKSLHQGGMVIPRLDNFVCYSVSSYYQSIEWKVNYTSICSKCGSGYIYSGVFLWMRLLFQYISILLNYFRSNTECTSTSTSQPGFVWHSCDLMLVLVEIFRGWKDDGGSC